MDVFIKAAAGVLITAVISIILSKNSKDFSVLLIICVCTLVAGAAFYYLNEVIDFLKYLQEVGNLNSDLLSVLLKATGIGITTEITSMICVDSGNAALGKVIQLLCTAVILWLSLPLFKELLNVIQSVIGNI